MQQVILEKSPTVSYNIFVQNETENNRLIYFLNLFNLYIFHYFNSDFYDIVQQQ